MSNHLKMELQQSIHALHTKGYSERKIARTLGIHRKTVHAYLIQANSGSKGTKVPAGSEPPNRHACATFSEQIREKLEQGLSAQRIYQDLQHEHAYKGGYDSIKRYVRKLKQTHPKLIERLESEPGEELQIDYGEAYVLAGTKRKRKAHILRLTLSCSRKSYSEAFTSQHTENFIRGIENAFRYFGGVTACINVDNLKAAVLKADWYDPEINPKLLSFCKHYDTSILPCIPRKPQHKGKVEAGIKYVKNNALKGRIFDSLASLNEHLLDWEQTIADKRIHGTTRKQVGEDFEQNEKPHLKCLPQGLFPCFEEAPRKVHRDGYVTVAKAYYRLGAEYYRANVWARWDARQVRLYDHNMQQIRVYTRLEPGKFSEVLGTQGCPESISQSLQYWQNQVNSYGPHATTWTQRIVHQRGDAALRTLMGISDLKALRLSGVLETLEVRLQEAQGNRLPHEQFLELLIQDEMDIRNQRKIQRRTKTAAFREMRTLEDFDFSFNNTIARDKIYELATGKFLAQRQDILFAGPPGTGKSHLAQAIGYQLIKLGKNVLYRSIFDLLDDLRQDEQLPKHERTLNRYLKCDLLIIDDMGIKVLPPKSGEYLFEIIMRRYELKSTLMTTNRPIDEWGKLIGDIPATTAILDRFLHHAHIIKFAGKSYRMSNAAKDNSQPSGTL